MITGLPGTVEEVLEQLGIIVASVGSQEISASCPFHADSHPSFSINIESGLWICYQCGESGTLAMLVDKVSKGTVRPDVLLKELSRQKIGKEKAPQEAELPKDPRLLQAEYEATGEVPDWALAERGFNRSIANEFGLRWNRGWIIPIWSPGAALWGWQFKRLDVMLNYPRSVKKSQTLFGLRELGDPCAALVESPLDVCKLAQHGVPALASYGAMVSHDQLGIIIDNLDRVVLALDNDEEGQRQSNKVWEYLARFMPTCKAKRFKGIKDPGEMDYRQIERAFGDLIADDV